MKIKKVSPGAIAGSVIIAIIMTIVLFAVTNSLVMNQVFSEKFISETISNLFKADIPIVIEGEEYDSISEGVYGVLEQSIIEAAEEEQILSEKEIEDFMEDTELEQFVAERFSEGIEAIILGKDVEVLTEDDILDFVEDNEDVFEDTFDIEITDDMLDELEEELKEANLEENFSTGVIVDEIYNEETNPIAPLMKTFRTFISTPMVIGGYVIVLVMFMLIFLLNKCQLSFAGPYLGVSTIVVGVFQFLTSITTTGLVAFADEESAEIISLFVKPLSSLMTTISIIYLVIGIVIVVASAIVKSVKKKKAMKEQSA